MNMPILPLAWASPVTVAKRRNHARQVRVPAALEVERGQLLRLMNPDRHAPCIWLVVAPAGYGKTTLLTQLERQHQQLGRQVTHLHAAELPTLLEALQTAPPTTILLDSMESLSDESQTLLQRVIDGWPPGHTLVCAGRSLLNLRVGRSLLDAVAAEIGTHDLAFDTSELIDLAHQLGVTDRLEAVVQSVSRQTRGWPAGARALLLASRAGVSPTDAVPSTLVRYVEEEICSAFTGSQLNTLMDLATLETFNLPLLAGLPGQPVHWEELDGLRRAGACIETFEGERIEGSHEWFRLNPLAARVLALRQQTLNHLRSRLLQQYAANWRAQHAPTPAPVAATQPKQSPFHLSPRETEILRFLAEGLSAKEIAARLSLSVSTVKTHRKKIYSKMSVARRSQAIAAGRAIGLI